jgi:putative endonuclease
MPYMYILECIDGSYYTGSTWNLSKRCIQHKKRIGARFTAKHLPLKTVYYEKFERIDDAFNREKQIQGWSHAKKKALINRNIQELKKISKKDFSQYRSSSRRTGRTEMSAEPEKRGRP